jgi:hypothetical protein
MLKDLSFFLAANSGWWNLTGKIAVSYKTLLLLEHLLITHGPLRVAEEFQCDKDVIKEMVSFQFVHEKGSVINKLINVQFYGL